MIRPLALPLLAIASVAVACTSKEAQMADTTKMPPPAAAPPTAAAMIVSPANGDSVKGPDVTVKMSAMGFKVDKANAMREDGVGHFHLFLDTTVTADTVPIPPTSPRIVHIGTGDSTYTFKGVAAGAHQLIVVAAYGNHVPMMTRRDTVHFVVK